MRTNLPCNPNRIEGNCRVQSSSVIVEVVELLDVRNIAVIIAWLSARNNLNRRITGLNDQGQTSTSASTRGHFRLVGCQNVVSFRYPIMPGHCWRRISNPKHSHLFAECEQFSFALSRFLFV